MLKRLLIAVFVIGLILAFNGTAFSTDLNRDDAKLSVDRHPAAVGTLSRPHGTWPMSATLPANHRAMPTVHEAPGFEAASPDTSTCGIYDQLHSPGLYTYIVQAANWTDRVALPFDIPVSHQMQISAVRVRTYKVVGTPSLTIQIHQDNLGNPGAVVYSQTFALSPLAYPGGTKTCTLASPQTYSSGPMWITVGQTGAATDSVGIGINTDPAGGTTGRSRYSLDGINYVTFVAAGFAQDWDPRLSITRCVWYTSCYSNVIDPRGMYSILVPDGPYGDGSFQNGIAQRFVAEGPETITAVKVMTVDLTGTVYPGVGVLPPQYFYGPASTNGITVSVWADSSGSIDKSTGALYSAVLPGGLANFYPATSNNGSALPLRRDTAFVPFPGRPVVIGPYHITVQSTSNNPADGAVFFRFGVDATYGGGSVNFTPPGGEWERAATNVNFDAWDGSWDIRPQLCKDEFKVCKNTVLYDDPGPFWYWAPITATSIRGAMAQRIKANPVNRVEKLRFQVDFGGPGNVGLVAKIWSASTLGPGGVLYSQVVTTPTFYPGWTEVVIPGGVQVLGDFYIGYEANIVDPADELWPMTEDGAHAGTHIMQNGGVWDYRRTAPTPPNYWRSLNDAFGYDDNLMAEVEFCSIPTQERACTSESDWPTFQHDFARTGASGVSIGLDAYCDLTLNWSHIRPTARGTIENGPIIWNSKVICAFSSGIKGSYEVFDLATGTHLYSFDALTYPNEIGGNIHCTPTVATVTIGGTPTPVLFLSGGNPGSISAFNLTGAFPAAPTLLWSVNAATAYLGHTTGMGATRYGNIIFLTIGSSEVVYWASDDNLVYAANAATGLPYAPFDGNASGVSPYTPFNLGLSSLKSGATDGNLLFYGLFNTGGDGKVIAVNPSNGTQAWVFGAPNLKGAGLFPTTSSETFECGVSTADGEVYANSRMLVTTSAGRRGVFYRLKASDGSILSYTAGDRARTSHPTIDKNLVFVPTFPAFAPETSAPLGGSLTVFKRLNGFVQYGTHSFLSAELGGQNGYFAEGLLTCEPDSSDWFWAFNTAGYLSCFKADNGSERFNRRVEHGGLSGAIPANSQGGTGAVGRDALGKAHIVYVDFYGGIYDLTKQVPRARLELLINSGSTAVPFASPADTVVEFKKAYTNTGCTPLTVTLTASSTSNGTRPPVSGGGTISARLAGNSASLASQLTSNTSYFSIDENGTKHLGRDLGAADLVYTDVVNTRPVSNPAAAAVPAFLNQNLGSFPGDVFVPAFGGFVLNPGDTLGIKVRANGPLVNRGPNSFYVEFTSYNDADYYLDNAARRPEIYLTLVGGCLLDTTLMTFGAGSVNKQIVTNTSRLANGDWDTGPMLTHGFTIDGHKEIMYQAYTVYAVSEARQAFNSEAWHGGGPNDAIISSQGNPNWCDLSCKPQLTTSVAMGNISTDGVTYTPISGKVVCRSYIDSVQNFDDGAGGWDWTLFTSPFDNDSTMGMNVNSKVYGVVDAPTAAKLLNNLTLDIMTVSERNNRAVNGWKMGAYNDNDLGGAGGRDTAQWSGTYSAGWAVDNSGTGLVAGFIKVPFGCGYTPLKNTVAVPQALWSYIDNWNLNWAYMISAPGAYSLDMTGSADQATFWTFTEHDFTPLGTYKFGLAFFAYAGMTQGLSATGDGGKIANTALLVNKWAGFGRGDVNNDGLVNLADIIYLATNVNYSGPSPIPFKHLGDVNVSGGVANMADVQYLVDYYFNYGPCPKGDWVL